MALEMEDAFPGNVTEFGRLDLVQSVFARTKAGERVFIGVARVDDSALIPIPAIDLNRIFHVGPRSHRPRGAATALFDHVARGERNDLYPTVIEKRRRKDQECVGLLLQETREGCINFPISAGGKGFDLQS